MEVVRVPLSLAEERRNDNVTAFGRLSKSRLCGMTCVWSPDAGVYCVPTLVTLALVFGTVFSLWDEIGSIELCVLALFLAMAFISSFLVICTDPGVYPRMRLGESDPLHEEKDLVYCRVCCFRRPPRVSHCYQCNVCVKEHDHHCGIIGGCVGQRSLRWFTLYLVTITLASGMGLFLIFRSLLTISFVPGNAVPYTPVKDTRPPRSATYDQEGAVKAVILVALLVCLMIVELLVGSLGVFYVYLTLTSTTRRESQKNHSKLSVLMRPRLVWDNIKHVACPPRSALVYHSPDTGLPTLV